MYNKILAPLDGSKFSECSLSHVKEIASGCHVGKVVLMTILKPVFMPGEWWTTSSKQIEKMNEAIEEQENLAQQNAFNYLTGIGESLKQSGIEVETVVIKDKDAYEVAETILKYAEENNIDLIVMSTHGRSGPSRWAFGSVADRVVRHSKTPVLTVAPSGCRL